jgi:hypothetical protein
MPERGLMMKMNYGIFRPRQAKVEVVASKSEAKAEQTTAAATAIISAEASTREAKMKRLREARLHREALASKTTKP